MSRYPTADLPTLTHRYLVLPSAHRMRNAADFSAAVRRGRRVRCGRLVVHALLPTATGDVSRVATVGLVVGKSVGGSVVRHRVSRRLRGVLARRVAVLPAGSATVVRALPPAASASSVDLAADLDAALDRLLPAPR